MHNANLRSSREEMEKFLLSIGSPHISKNVTSFIDFALRFEEDTLQALEKGTHKPLEAEEAKLKIWGFPRVPDHATSDMIAIFRIMMDVDAFCKRKFEAAVATAPCLRSSHSAMEEFLLSLLSPQINQNIGQLVDYALALEDDTFRDLERGTYEPLDFEVMIAQAKIASSHATSENEIAKLQIMLAVEERCKRKFEEAATSATRATDYKNLKSSHREMQEFILSIPQSYIREYVKPCPFTLESVTAYALKVENDALYAMSKGGAPRKMTIEDMCQYLYGKTLGMTTNEIRFAQVMQVVDEHACRRYEEAHPAPVIEHIPLTNEHLDASRMQGIVDALGLFLPLTLTEVEKIRIAGIVAMRVRWADEKANFITVRKR